MQENSRIAGPGAIEDAPTGILPRLDGASENEYIEIVNPLSDTFAARVASSRPVNAPVRIVVNQETPTATRTEDDLRRNYGLDLRNPDHKSLSHISQTVVIEPGKTIRLPGNEAQVVVKQLVNEILSREGKKLFMGDPFARQQIEDRIIIKRGSMSEFFGTQQLNMREELNKEPENGSEEESFPDISDDSGEDNGSPDPARQPSNRNRSRSNAPKPAKS